MGHEITLPASGAAAAATAYTNIPPRPTRGMVIIHEAFGRAPEIDGVADRFAARGYAAVAPVLFKSMFSPACIRRVMQTLTTGEGAYVDCLRGARSWLCSQTGLVPDQVGLIGFCLGGGFALASGSGWAAVSTNYGEVPKADVMKGIGPVIGCYGGRDMIYGKTAAKLKHVLEPEGVEVEAHTYPTVGHSFLTNGHHPVARVVSGPLMRFRYDPAIAEEGWAQILGFMDRHLEEKAGRALV